MAADHALRRELSRRIRDDLMQLGIVAAGPAVRKDLTEREVLRVKTLADGLTPADSGVRAARAMTSARAGRLCDT
jgi:hypothetical protein